MSNYRFFKYRDINKNSIASLVKGCLYFSPPEKLKDPFDCRLDIRQSILNAASYLIGEESKKLHDLSKNEELYKHLQTDISCLGICSFSLTLKNVLMWSHYANDHKGMSILYDFPEEYLNDGKTFIGISDVSYKQDSLTNWFKEMAGKLPIDFDDFVLELAKQLVTLKSPDWYYEEEVRIIRPQPGVLKIQKDYIKQICFGLHASDTDIELVREITSRYDHDVELCRVVRTTQDFGIDIDEI